MARTTPASQEREPGAPGWLAWLVALPLAALTVVALGALALDLTAAGPVAAGVAAAVVALVVPWSLDRGITRAYRRLDPAAQGIGAQVTALWNLAVLTALVLAATSSLGRALQTHGDWMFADAHGAATDGARGAIRGVGARLAGGAAPVVDAVAHDAGTPTRRVDAATVAAHVDAGAADVAAPIPTDRDLTPQEIFRLRADAVVVVTARGRADTASVLARLTGISAPVVSGSGFVVDADGLVVTNEHVIHGATSVRVTLRDGRAFTPVTLLAVDRAHDLALLRIDARALPTAPISQDDVVAVGTHATAIGSPLGLTYTLTDGLISAARDVEGTSFLQVETAIAPGSSGGPLFDPRGRVIGVTTAMTGAASMNLALHPRYVRAILARERAPRALEAFVPEATVVGLEVDGAEASPVERMNLDGAAQMLAAGVESCRARAPRATRITVRYDSTPDSARDGGIPVPLAFRRGRVETDLGADGEACLGENLRFTGARVMAALEHDHDDELRAGRSLTVRFEVRLGRGEGDAAARSIAVRFELAPRGDAGDDDAGGE